MLPETNVILSELGTNAVECQALSHLLQSAYQGKVDAIELDTALKKNQESLSNPLWHKTRNQQSFQYIINNRNNYQLDGIYNRFQLSDPDISLINKFSESTNLDQKYVVGFLRDARIQIETEKQRQRSLSFLNQTQNRNDIPSIREFIKNAYFNARKLRLNVLKELIIVYDRIAPQNDDNKMQEDEEQVYPEELRKIINSAVQHIFSKNVIKNLSTSIQNISRMRDVTFRDEYQMEICDCIRIFYAISQRVQCNVSDIQSLLDVFESMVVNNREFALDHSRRIQGCSYLLSLALYQIMDPSDHSPYINPRDGSKFGKNIILKADELNTKLNTVINNLATIQSDRSKQRHSASFLLLIIAMVKKIEAKVEQNTYNTKHCGTALRHGALKGLYDDFLLNIDEYNNIKSTIFVTLADCICELFELCDKETRDYYASETSQRQQYGSRGHRRKQKGLTTMLRVLIHLAHHSQPFCNIFIKNAAGKSFIGFLDNSLDIPTPWFHLYAQFIYELARVEPALVYQQITTEKCEKLTVDAIWQILDKTAQIYIPKSTTVSTSMYVNENMNSSNLDSNPYSRLGMSNMSNMMNTGPTEVVWEEIPKMTDQEIRIVCSVLKVLEALGCIDAVYQQLNAQRSGGIIQLLFRLLKCSVPTTVMSQTIACIAAFIKQRPNLADEVWQLLEINQILYTWRQKNQPITKGVELDIIEGEKDGQDAIYPSTVTFCRLLKNLLITTKIPQALGQTLRGQRPPGIHPYTDYVRDFVFLRWAKREYKLPQEQWEIAATCLQIFDALLDKFDPAQLSPTANIRYLFTLHPSFELLTLLLAPHSNLIEVILDIFQKAFNIIDSSDTQYSDDTMGFVKSAMKNSLNLIYKAIEKEESFLNICQRHWPQKLSLRPLNTTLLSQQYREQIISLGKCVEFGNDVYVASYSLSILSHLNKTQQGITLRSVFNDQIHILQSSFSSQLYNFTEKMPDLPDIRVAIIQFLLTSIKTSGHNLGLMLLAFSEQSAQRDQLQSSISCLNAILRISKDSEFCLSSPPFAEGCFELLYRLLSNSRIGERFLKAAEDVCSSYFVVMLRQNIGCTNLLDGDGDKEKTICYLNQRAWLLRAISFEFHLMNSFNTTILDAGDITYLGFLNHENMETTECALWKLFEQLDIEIDVVNQLDHTPHIWGINMDQFKIYANQQNDETYTWNIKKLYYTLQRAPGGQAVRDKEIQLQQIAQAALNHNTRVALMTALDRAYDSWAQLIRCILGNKLIGYNNMNNSLLLRLLDRILERLSARVFGAAFGRVSNIMSQVALDIMYYFRCSLTAESPVQITIVGCRTILEGMITAILMQKDVRNPRANLYSCLSNYLHYCKYKIPNVLSDADESNAINLNEKVSTEKDKLNKCNVATLLSRKQELLNILFGDSVSKDAYLSSVASLVLQDLLSANDNVQLEDSNASPPQVWLSMMLDKSRLLILLKSACDLDEHIQRALASQRHVYFLYQFESMMNVLISASIFKAGSTELIDNNCISQYLTELKCLTSRVFWTAYSSSTQNQSSLNPDNNSLSMECSRYLQLLTPCLRLINSMLASCSKNVRLHYQTLTFFQRHNDIVNKLLTLDNNELVVLRCVKLILCIWYQLFCGPLYIRDPNRISSLPARDSTIMEHIQSKLPIFYFLIKKFKDMAFKTEYLQNDLDNDFDIMNNNMYPRNGETQESISREIIRVLLNIFRIDSIGSSVISSMSQSGPRFKQIFDQDLNTSSRINDDPPNLRLLCDCLKGMLPISKKTGGWITDKNEELRRISTSDNAAMLTKLQDIEPMLSTVSTDVSLQCYLIENILLLLYFHCEFNLRTLQTDFYQKFIAVVMSEVIEPLKEWYDDEATCILHVNQDMIERKWSSGVQIPKQSKAFIEIMMQKFYNLARDHQTVLSIAQ